MRKFCLFLFALSVVLRAAAATLHVGAGQPYPTLSAAIGAVQPGDTIQMHAGTYPGGLYFADVQGTTSQWITIRNAPGETVIFEGGNNAIQLTDPAYLHVRGLIFQHQTGNGVNTDDGGTYDTPAHHVIFEDCIFRDMAASGNNDLLKLSGLDSFTVRNCQFRNGAEGGSGIDMVGCHYGTITNNIFENQGSNAIQCKGGSERVRIQANFFRDCGQRTLNLGGSTGLQFFRPDTAHFEAAYIQVYANIIVGSWAPIAYVGAVHVAVVNNTIYQPEHWVIRILQETVDPDRFLPCGNNSFVNNIIYLGSSVVTETNVGPNTAPETFGFARNLWFNADDPNWSGPDLPVPDVGSFVNVDPLLANPAANDFSIPLNSPAVGIGILVPAVGTDFLGQTYAILPSLGAIEANPVSGLNTPVEPIPWEVSPNPTAGILTLQWPETAAMNVRVQVLDALGRPVLEQDFPAEARSGQLDLSASPNGWYAVRLLAGTQAWGWRAVLKE